MSVERVVVGIPRFDAIVRGGLVAANTYVVAGAPGCGKTIFANQVCFAHVRKGGRAVYVTLVIESHAKMLRHISEFDFYDVKALGEGIRYLSGDSALRERGLRGLLEVVTDAVQTHNASMLVIDGIESAQDLASTSQEFRQFVHDLQGFTSLARCTTLLLSNKTDRDNPAHAVVDGIFEFSDQLVGPRAVRELTIHKFRGSDYLRGRHEVEIIQSGMTIHPRTEVHFDGPSSSGDEKRVRMPFGVQGLDAMLGGGVPSGSTTAVIGAPGTGKTLLGLSFLAEGAKRGDPGVYFGFYEPTPRLIEKAEQCNIRIREHVESGLIKVIWQPPLEHYMDALAEQLLEPLRDGNVKRSRLFIDGLAGFRAAAVYPDRMPRFLSALTNQLRIFDVTTVVSEELPLFRPGVEMPHPELADVVETVIVCRYVELASQLSRLISIMKMRESAYDTHIREFKISSEGVDVADSFESAEAILSGLPRGGAAR